MKSQFRQLAKDKLRSLSSSDLKTKSLSISKNLLKELELHFKPGSTVGVFIPIGFEPLWYLAFGDTYQLAIPKIESDSMRFILCDKDFIINSRGNYKAADEKALASSVDPDVLLIPGLAFTANGKRLGRGRGFYDRFLEKFKNKKIGICFNTQIFDEIPNDKWDQDMDQIITEKGKI